MKSWLSEDGVVRRNAKGSISYNFEKYGLARLFLHICSEQNHAERLGLRGCFADRVKKEQAIHRPTYWYQMVNGGELG